MTIRLTEQEAKRLGLVGTGNDRARKKNRPAGITARRSKTKTPQRVLFECCKVYWPDCVEEFEGAIPGRRFRIDIAFPEKKIAIELDGHVAHSHKDKFQRDRERQNLLTLHGWLILRFTAGDVRTRLTETLGLIQACLSNYDASKSNKIKADES